MTTEHSPLAPTPQFPERAHTYYGIKRSDEPGQQKGRLRFEEGIGTDTDVPSDFTTGAMQGFVPAPGRPNHNRPVWIKPPEETMKQRAHVGSAAWPEAPEFLGGFARGASHEGEQRYIMDVRSGGHQERPNYAKVREA